MKKNTLETPKFVLDMVKHQMGLYEQLSASIASSFDASLYASLQLQHNLLESLMPGDRLMHSMDFFIKELEKQEEQEKIIRSDPNYKKFPFLMAGTLPNYLMSKLTGYWAEGKRKEVYDLLYSATCDSETQTDLIREWIDEPLFQTREIIIRDAFEAHKNGKFSLSIPVLYAALDGVMITSFEEEMKRVPAKQCEKCGTPLPMSPPNAKHISRQLKQNLNENDAMLDFYGVIQFILSTYDNRRSKILHGLEVDYHKDQNLSTLLILALDSAHFLIQKKKEITQGKTTCNVSERSSESGAS